MKNIKIFLLCFISGTALYSSSRDNISLTDSIRTELAVIHQLSDESELTRAQLIASQIVELSAQLPEAQIGHLASSMSLASLLADDLRATCQKKIIELLFLNNGKYCKAHSDDVLLQKKFAEQKTAVDIIKQCHKDPKRSVNLEGLKERKARAYLKAFWLGITLQMIIQSRRVQ